MYFDSLQGWLHWQEHLHPKPIDLDLARARQVYLGLNPSAEKPWTITVGGTNGKGSCVAMLEAMYLAQGYRVGAYTSPHILRYNERIKIDGQPVEDAPICRAFERIEQVRNGISLSYFEFGTLAALDIFRRERVDIQLLEVGLGGRLDAVNLIDTDTAIITSVCLDHCDWLGGTREAIGHEKAGIFRQDRPAIISDPDPPLSLCRWAETIHAPIYRLGHEFDYVKHDTGWTWCAGARRLDGLPYPALPGEHQLRNASAALLALAMLEAHLPVELDAKRRGLREMRIAGRFQRIDGEKCPVLVDVGHNPQAARTLWEHVTSAYPGRRIRAVFAMMKDKDIAGVIEIMRQVVYRWYVAPLPQARAANEATMREIFAQCGVDAVCSGFADFSEAFRRARDEATPEDLILVFGSFFLVSEYFKTLQR